MALLPFAQPRPQLARHRSHPALLQQQRRWGPARGGLQAVAALPDGSPLQSFREHESLLRSLESGIDLSQPLDLLREQLERLEELQHQLPAPESLSALRGSELESAAGVATKAAVGAAAAAGGALQAGVASLDLFGGRWDLNLLFFAVIGTLAYALLVIAPRQ